MQLAISDSLGYICMYLCVDDVPGLTSSGLVASVRYIR
jgi:hypothetical protein